MKFTITLKIEKAREYLDLLQKLKDVSNHRSRIISGIAPEEVSEYCEKIRELTKKKHSFDDLKEVKLEYGDYINMLAKIKLARQMIKSLGTMNDEQLVKGEVPGISKITIRRA